MSKPTFVEAETIQPGDLFRRPSGQTTYIRIHPPSVKFWGLNEEDVFAVATNDLGRMISLIAYEEVIPVPISELSTPFREAYLTAKGV